jgi:ABC-type thiamine transport system substrate-binding protein
MKLNYQLHTLLKDKIRKKNSIKKRHNKIILVNPQNSWPGLWNQDKFIENKPKQLWSLIPNQLNVKG